MLPLSALVIIILGSLLQDFLEYCLLIDRFCSSRFANPHHASLTIFDRATSRYLLGHICAFLLYVGFTLFIVLLYIVISLRFSFYTSTFWGGMLSPISHNVIVSITFFVFVRHTAHCFLLLVNCMIYG